jgi:hypothetical protein
MTTARKIIGYLGYITVFVAVSFGASMVAHPAADTTPAPAHTATKAAVTCTAPAPTSATGFTTMFAAVPPAQWGAADVSISVPLTGHRSVWLYGDTFSTGRFVHSTAIVQTGGCLHVSHAGAQLLPNDDATHIYWIQSAVARTGGLSITARAITLTPGGGVWGFADAGYQRTAYATVNAAGDVTFARWTSKTVTPAPNPGALYSLGDGNTHHFGYARHTHPEFKLTSGLTLTTTCQNWDDGLHPVAQYRPIFTEG